MSSTSSPTLIPDVRARRSETVVAVLMITAGCAAPLLIDALSLLDAALAGVLLTALLAFVFMRAGWLGAARRIQRIVWAADGEWTLTDARGRCFQAALDDASRVWPPVVWLRWRPEGNNGSTRSMLLTRLDLPACDLRRLVIRLRLDRLTTHGSASGVAVV